ncbi:MAG TPA: GTPase Era [Gammaproteobacteria bacterium]
MSESPFRSGFVAIVGRPNVGKSTLLNRILGQKISITSRKPQTTRHRILGIKTDEVSQAVYVDTPGLHLNAKKAMNRFMNKAVTTTLDDVDLILFVIEAGEWNEEDENVLQRLKNAKVPVMLVVNKIDRLADKEALLPLMQSLADKMSFIEIVPLSAQNGSNVAELERTVVRYLPEAAPMFPADQITDRSERFLAAEIVREKLMRELGQELPYAVTVEIEQFKEEEGLLRISALIWVERDSQKRIVIGKKGEQLKEIGRQARIDMEKLFDNKVFLQLWVKVKEGWSDNERLLNSLGYREE